MAGDEDRPQPEPVDAEPARPLGPQSMADGLPEAVAAQEPSMAAGAADPAAPDRPAGGFGEPSFPASGPASPRRSLMPTVLALIGVVLILLLAANLYTLYNPPGTDAVPALQSEAAALRQRVSTLEGRAQVDLGPLQSRVAALADEVGPLKAAIDRDAVAGQAVTAAQTAMAPLSAEVTDLDSRVTGLKDAVAALPKVDLGPIATTLGGLETRVGSLDEKVAGLDEKGASLAQRLPPLESYFNAPKTPAQATEMRENGSGAESRAAPLAVVAQGLLVTIPTGRPFETEVKALAQLGVNAAALEPLHAVARTGAATDQDLVQGFSAVQDDIVTAAAPLSTGTMLDRMMANVQSVVKVSRTGAGPGEGADAVAFRIAADLKAGALAAAAAEWERLPDASRARSADWAARLKARIAAEGAARSIRTGAVDVLATAP